MHDNSRKTHLCLIKIEKCQKIDILGLKKSKKWICSNFFMTKEKVVANNVNKNFTEDEKFENSKKI